MTVFRTQEAADEVHRLYRTVLDGWPVPRTEIRLPTCQGETFVVASGNESSPPVIVLHGAQANAAAGMFDATLWSRRFRVFLVDVIGEAGFSAPSRPPLSGDDHALWLADVMRGLGLKKAAFVGTSLGGWLALDYAKRNIETVERLALICPAGIGRGRNFLLRAAPLLLLGRWGRQRMREMVMGPSPGHIPPAMQPFVDMMELIGRTIRPRIVRIPQLNDAEIGSLNIPILAIVGGHDVLIDSVETKGRLESCASNATVKFVPDGRHFLPGEGATVMEFLIGSQMDCISA
jgi:pimeloyl-ACP methyl ester carboxylesterase